MHSPREFRDAWARAVRRIDGSGSTPIHLATLTTGRGGSGSAESKAQQAEIVRLLEERVATERRS